MRIKTQVGGEELEVVVRWQRAQLLLQLLLGEARGQAADDHLTQGRPLLLARFARTAPATGGRGWLRLSFPLRRVAVELYF